MGLTEESFRFESTENDRECARKEIKVKMLKINGVMGRIFEIIPMLCKSCNRCCCKDCTNGYFSQETIRYGGYAFNQAEIYKEEIKATLKKLTQKCKGFLHPKKGCMLPRNARSLTCAFFLEYRCSIADSNLYGRISRIMTDVRYILSSKPDKCIGDLENLEYFLKNINPKLLKQINRDTHNRW